MGLARIYPYTKFEVSSSFTRFRFTEGGLKFNFWPLDPDYALFGGILSCLRWDLPRSIRVPNLKFLASPVPYGRGFKINKFCPWTLTTPLWGIFVVREMGIARIYPYTKFEVSNFTRSKDTTHVQLNGWMSEGVCPNSRMDLRRFLSDPHQIWHQYSRMINALQ